MSLTPEQLELRKSGIGGSDAAAALGMSRWESQMSLYLNKIGATDSVPENEAMFWGSRAEREIAAAFLEGVPGKTDGHPEFTLQPGDEVGTLFSRSEPFMLATPDGFLFGHGDAHPVALWECKTASAHKAREWRDEEVPTEYWIQVQHSLYVFEMDLCYLSVRIGGNDYREYTIHADPEAQARIIEREREFWTMVVNRTPPAIDGSDASTRVLNFLYPGSEVTPDPIELPPIAEALCADYLAAKEVAKSAEEHVDELGNQIKEMLGLHEVGIVPGFRVKWGTRTRVGGLDAKALTAEHPEIARTFTKPATVYRVLDVKED